VEGSRSDFREFITASTCPFLPAHAQISNPPL